MSARLPYGKVLETGKVGSDTFWENSLHWHPSFKWIYQPPERAKRNYVADFGPLNGLSEKIAKKNSENEEGDQRPLGTYPKIIRFGTVTRPLFYYRALGADSKSGYLYFLLSGHNSTGNI